MASRTTTGAPRSFLQNDGRSLTFFFDNRYCWIMRFHPESGKIIKLREYLNTALVREVHEATDNV